MNDINQCIALIDEKPEHYRLKYAAIIKHLTTMIGVTEASALYILGEIGADMSVWRDSASLASWAGLSPANNESANKKEIHKGWEWRALPQAPARAVCPCRCQEHKEGTLLLLQIPDAEKAPRP